MTDQIRECRAWAEEQGIEVPEALVFQDCGKSGRLRRRPGRLAMQEALEKDAFDVLIAFTTNRLERNSYRIQQFVREEIVERSKRAVFICSHVDTDQSDWEVQLQVRGITDELQVRFGKEAIHSGHKGLFLRQRVCGTITFGYTGKEIPEAFTKMGQPTRKYVIDDVAATWVRRAFQWYAHEGHSMGDVTRMLNEQGAPLPPRCATGRWTPLAVKTLLKNTRYRGHWEYGRKESQLLNRKDYVRQVPREKPLAEQQFEELRIVDDSTWYRSQQLMATNKHVAGRRPKDGDRRSRPRILNGLLVCGYHHRLLVTGGGQGTKMVCPVCKDTGGQLYTMLDRRLATQMICKTIAELIGRDTELVPRIIDTCRRAAEECGRPDAGKLKELHLHLDHLTRQIDVVRDDPIETDRDVRERRERLSQLQRQRAMVEYELVQFEADTKSPPRVPEPDEVRVMVENLSGILTDCALTGATARTAEVRQAVERTTGGVINIFQVGERRRGQGWLRGTFRPQVVGHLAEVFGVTVPGMLTTTPPEVTIEFREPPVVERLADRVKELFDRGLKFRDIAEKVGYSRKLVTEALGHWYGVRGLIAPDGRKCISRLPRGPRLAERIADDVMALIIQDVPLQDIAEKLGTSRNRITKAIRIWHERRGLGVPDGRALRKLRNRKRRMTA